MKALKKTKRHSVVFPPPLLPIPLKVRAGTIFDNFLITDDEVYAEDFGDETWGETKVA